MLKNSARSYTTRTIENVILINESKIHIECNDGKAYTLHTLHVLI